MGQINIDETNSFKASTLGQILRCGWPFAETIGLLFGGNPGMGGGSDPLLQTEEDYRHLGHFLSFLLE